MTRICLLSTEPDEAVQWLADADVIRMPIEIAQVLLTAWHKVKPGHFSLVINYLDGDPWLEWVMASAGNYEELWNYGMDLVSEHYHRYGSRRTPPYVHGISRQLESLAALPPLPSVGLTPLPITTEQARLSYNTAGIFNCYTHRVKPEWKDIV